MKTKRILHVMALSLACMASQAQGRFDVVDVTSSVFLSYSPLGQIQPILQKGSDKAIFNYKDYWGATVSLDGRIGERSLYEFGFDYGKAKFDKLELKGDPQGLDFTAPKDIYHVSMSMLFGTGIPLGDRFEIPLYIGPGATYLNGSPFHNLLFSPTAKLRLKGYVTNKIGLYVGGTARYNIGLKNAGDDLSYYIHGLQWRVEAGIVISAGAGSAVMIY